MSNYLIEFSAIHIALTLAYWFVLKKERQYNTMRFYLLGSAVLALTVPLFKLPTLFNKKIRTREQFKMHVSFSRGVICEASRARVGENEKR